MVATMVRELTNKQPVRVGKIIYLPNSPKPSGYIVRNLPDFFYRATTPMRAAQK